MQLRNFGWWVSSIVLLSLIHEIHWVVRPNSLGRGGMIHTQGHAQTSLGVPPTSLRHPQERSDEGSPCTKCAILSRRRRIPLHWRLSPKSSFRGATKLRRRNLLPSPSLRHPEKPATPLKRGIKKVRADIESIAKEILLNWENK